MVPWSINYPIYRARICSSSSKVWEKKRGASRDRVELHRRNLKSRSLFQSPDVPFNIPHSSQLLISSCFSITFSFFPKCCIAKAHGQTVMEKKLGVSAGHPVRYELPLKVICRVIRAWMYITRIGCVNPKENSSPLCMSRSATWYIHTCTYFPSGKCDEGYDITRPDFDQKLRELQTTWSKATKVWEIKKMIWENEENQWYSLLAWVHGELPQTSFSFFLIDAIVNEGLN